MTPKDEPEATYPPHSVRNRYGVKDASDCYRTVNGVLYLAHLSFPTKDRIKLYRDSGVRCRRFGEELFIAALDRDAANQIDFNNPLQ